MANSAPSLPPQSFLALEIVPTAQQGGQTYMGVLEGTTVRLVARDAAAKLQLTSSPPPQMFVESGNKK